MIVVKISSCNKGKFGATIRLVWVIMFCSKSWLTRVDFDVMLSCNLAEGVFKIYLYVLVISQLLALA